MVSTQKILFHDWSLRFRLEYYELCHDTAIEILLSISISIPYRNATFTLKRTQRRQQH